MPLTLEIALGVAGGLFIFAAAKGLVELPGQIAERRQRERMHDEFIKSLVGVGDRAVAAAQEAMAKKPRRKPAVKKAAPGRSAAHAAAAKRGDKARAAVAKKGATNGKTKARG